MFNGIRLQIAKSKRIQNLRKDNNFNVTDRIEIRLQKLAEVEKAVSDFGQYIMKETLADDIQWMSDSKGQKVDLVDDIEIFIDVERKS